MTNLKMKADVTTFEDAIKFLGGETQKEFGHNTYMTRLSSGSVAVTYHKTEIVTYHPNGTITLDNGGWHTVTTARRMHRLTPSNVRVGVRNRLMYVERVTDDGVTTTTGARIVTLHPDGR